MYVPFQYKSQTITIKPAESFKRINKLQATLLDTEETPFEKTDRAKLP